MAINLQSKARRQSGFTLIELLAVLVIMGILIIFAIPAAEKLLKSGGLSAATREVSNTLSLARQYAITHRTNARVIFAYNGSANASSNMWYTGYAVVVSNSATGGWDYAGKWDFLPAGAVFLSQNMGGSFGGGFNLENSVRNGFSITNAPYPNAPFAYIEFGPTGTDTRDVVDQLTLAEGFVQGGTITFRTSVNYVNFTVDNIVGRVQVARP